MWHVIKSVLSAFLGVRNTQKAEEDFSQQSLLPYVIVGIVFILLFVATLFIIVRIVIQ